MSTPAPSPTTSPAHPHLESPVLLYARPGVGRGDFWTVYHGVVVAALVTGVIGALFVGWFRYRARAYAIQSSAGAERALVQSIRSQVALFKLQHGGRLPGACPLVTSGGPPDANQATFWAQMTRYTDVDGNTSPTKSARYCYGPYMQSIPANWLNGSRTLASKPARGVGFVYDFAGGAGSGKVWGVDSAGAVVTQ